MNVPNSLIRRWSLAPLAVAMAAFVGCQTAPSTSDGSSSASSSGSSTAVTAPAGSSVAKIETDLYTLQKSVSSQVTVGQPFDYVYTLTAHNALRSVVVNDEVPSGAQLISTSPTADVRGSAFSFPIGEMAAGETRTMTATMQANDVGTLVNCATVTAIPVACSTVVVGRAAIAVTKTVDRSTVKVGEPVNFTMSVVNEGNAVARNVVLTDRLPRELVPTVAGQPLSFTVGDLAPGEVRTFSIPVGTTVRGRFVNVVEGTASNVTPDANDRAEAAVTVLQPGLSIEKTGTAEQFINRNATYSIVVTNSGETTLSPVQVVDTVPAGNVIINAGGGTVNGNVISWVIPSLAAGDRETFSITVTNRQAGVTTNSVTATAPGDKLTASSQASTTWRGVAGVLVSLVDDPDPIMVGDTTTLTVLIRNQGNADITNVRAVLNLPAELSAVSTSAGQLAERRVTFPVTEVLPPQQSVTYTVVVRGAREGDARSRLTLETNETRAPIISEESTTVY